MIKLTWDSVFQAIILVVGSLGGGSAIILATTKWGSELLTSKIKADIEQKNKKEMAAYENQLADSTAKLKTLLQNSSYIIQQQYNLEMQIYKEVWSALFDLMCCRERVVDLKVLNPQILNILNENDFRAKRQNNSSILSDKLNAYQKVVDANAPFLQEDVYKVMKEITSEFYILNNISNKYKDEIRLVDQEDEKILDQACSAIDRKKELLVEMVRNYLQSLKCIDYFGAF